MAERAADGDNQIRLLRGTPLQKIFLFVLAAPFSISNASAQVQVTGCEITNVGIYEIKNQKATSAPGVATGNLMTEGTLNLIQSTSSIPARQGITFGYRYKLTGSPMGASVVVRDINIVPEPGLRN